MLRDRFAVRTADTAPATPPASPAVEPGAEAPPAAAVPDPVPAPPVAPARTLPVALPEGLRKLKDMVQQRLINELDQSRLSRLTGEEARDLVRDASGELLDQGGRGMGEFRQRVIEEILDDVLGLGPLEPLLREESVSEIMVNAPDQIFVEQGGRIYESGFVFRDEEHLLRIVERIVSPLGRHVDEGSPMVDARLPDGSRVNIVVPPAAPGGAKVTLRKFAKRRLRDEDLIRIGTLTPGSRDFLKAAVQAKLNILVSGGTGTGKTTMFNVLSSYIGEDERIVTIEDPLELQLQQRHVVPLEARPPGLEGTHQITQRDLVRNALRMRPDRIIIGEVRGGEAFDMLQAMNTGHEGSISTVHANTPRDAVSRVENMVLMAGFDLPDRAVREQVVSAIHLIVQISRLQDGSRRVTHITEVAGLEGQTVTLQDLFAFEMEGMDEEGRVIGALTPTGLRPHFSAQFALHGVKLPEEALRSDRW